MGEPNVAGSWDGMGLFKDGLGDTSKVLVLVDVYLEAFPGVIVSSDVGYEEFDMTNTLFAI